MKDGIEALTAVIATETKEMYRQARTLSALKNNVEAAERLYEEQKEKVSSLHKALKVLEECN